MVSAVTSEDTDLIIGEMERLLDKKLQLALK